MRSRFVLCNAIRSDLISKKSGMAVNGKGRLTMVKSRFAVLAASASLVATLGLAACGGQNASSSSAAASSSSEATSTTASSSSASTSAAAKKIVSWEGMLTDGNLVSYMNSEDGKQATLTITNTKTNDVKSWTGASTINGDKITITDTESKNTITINVSSVKEEDGTAEIEIEGYGKGTVVAFTAGEYQLLGEAEKALAEAAKTAK